jgi:hypothetical protein
MNQHDLDVLRALARLSRMRKAVDPESLALRSGGSIDDARASLQRLERESLVTDSESAPRLTMMGLAIAVSSAPSAMSRSRRGAVQAAPRVERRASSGTRRRAA